MVVPNHKYFLILSSSQNWNNIDNYPEYGPYGQAKYVFFFTKKNIFYLFDNILNLNWDVKRLFILVNLFLFDLIPILIYYTFLIEI